MFVSLHNSFQTKDYRAFRASLFAGLGLTGIVPIIHGWILNYDIAAVHRALGLDVIMGGTYLVGTLLQVCCKGFVCCYCSAQILRKSLNSMGAAVFICSLEVEVKLFTPVTCNHTSSLSVTQQCFVVSDLHAWSFC